MTGKSTKPEKTPLRLWLALVLLALLWILKRLPWMVEEKSIAIFMTSFLGPLACALAIIIWWLAASRATRREKLVGVGGLVAILVAAAFLVHPTLRGFPLLSGVVPWAMSAFVVGLVIARWVKPDRRVTVALLAVVLACGYWTLIRMDGVWGDFTSEKSWRWEPTPEDLYLAERGGNAPAGAVAGELAGVEWPGFRGPGRDSIVPGVVLAEDWEARPPKELWRIPVGPAWSSFAVAGRRLFTQEQRGDHEVVAAYDAETGAELWAHEYPSRFFETLGGVGPRATPTLAGGALYALGGEGLLHRLDPVTGEVIWQADLREEAGREPPTWGFSSSPLVVDGVVIVHAGGDGDRGVLAYGTEDGKLRWGAPAGGHTYSSPQLSQIGGMRSVPVVTDDGMTVLDPASGSVLWRYDWPFENYRVLQPLVVSDETVLMSTGFGIGTRRLDVRRAGDSFTAEERWTSRALKPDFNDLVLHEGSLYGFDPNILACADLETGERRWKGGRYGYGQLLLLPDADQLLVLSEKGIVALVRASPEGFEELTTLQVLEGKTWNHPVLVGDRLYLRNGGEAVALAMPLG